MPTQTFYNLPKSKQNRILSAGKKEFSKHTVETASVKNIVEEAGIPRGSFYAYFSSKQDFFDYLLMQFNVEHQRFTEEILQKAQGDLLKAFRYAHDFFLKKSMKHEPYNFIKNVYSNLKVGSNSEFFNFHNVHQLTSDQMDVIKNLIDFSNLSLSDDEIEPFMEIITAVTRSNIAYALRHGLNFQEASALFEKKLNILRHGVATNLENTISDRKKDTICSN